MAAPRVPAGAAAACAVIFAGGAAPCPQPTATPCPRIRRRPVSPASGRAQNCTRTSATSSSRTVTSTWARPAARDGHREQVAAGGNRLVHQERTFVRDFRVGLSGLAGVGGLPEDGDTCPLVRQLGDAAQRQPARVDDLQPDVSAVRGGEAQRGGGYHAARRSRASRAARTGRAAPRAAALPPAGGNGPEAPRPRTTAPSRCGTRRTRRRAGSACRPAGRSAARPAGRASVRRSPAAARRGRSAPSRR